MTVKGYTQELAAEDRELRLRCQWFAGKKLEEGIFPEKSLNAVEAK